MRFKNGLVPFDTLDFHYNRIFNQEVDPVFPNVPAFIVYWNRHLALEIQAAELKFYTGRFFIGLLQEPWPQVPVHLYSTSDDLLG